MSKLELDYAPLWNKLLRSNITKKELSIKSNVDINILYKMRNNKPVHLKVLLRICRFLGCRIRDIVKIRHDDTIFPPIDGDNLKLDYSGLHRLMKKYNLSDFELRKMTGLGYMMLKKIKNNEPIHLAAVLRLCECFECEIEDIVEVYN